VKICRLGGGDLGFKFLSLLSGCAFDSLPAGEVESEPFRLNREDVRDKK
jgi:hypothetical protein